MKNIEYASERTRLLCDNPGHMLLGISPFCGFFNQENIDSLVLFASRESAEFHVYIPTELSCYTLVGMGYPSHKAKKKTNSQDRYLVNKVRRALRKVLGDSEQIESRILTTNKLRNNPMYLQEYNRCCQLYATNEEFKAICRQATETALRSKSCGSGDMPVIADAIGCTVEYILHEIPLLMNTPGILGVRQSIFLYKSIPDFIRNLFNSDQMLHSNNQGFIGYSPNPVSSPISGALLESDGQINLGVDCG